MKPLTRRFTGLALSGFLLALALTRAVGESGASPDANALLNEARKNQTERERATMQRDLDRMAEEVNKGKQEMDDLSKSMSTVGNAVAETKSRLDQLAGRKKHIIQDLDLMPLRIEADKLKAEGLNLLNAAHEKAMDALTKRNEEIELRRTLLSAEMQRKLEPVAPGESEGKKGKSESVPTMTELRRNLQKAEGRTLLANERAREGMNAASQKLQQANAAAAKAEKKQAEIEVENNPTATPSSEPPKPKAKNGR